MLWYDWKCNIQGYAKDRGMIILIYFLKGNKFISKFQLVVSFAQQWLCLSVDEADLSLESLVSVPQRALSPTTFSLEETNYFR